MGKIHDDVYNYGSFNRDHEPLLKAFLQDFDVTWARDYRKYGADFTAYFLKPAGRTKQSIGIDREMALIVSEFPVLNASTLQAADAFLSELPARGRVESLAYALAAPVPNLSEEVRRYLSENQQSRLVVPFTWQELSKPANWFVRSRFTESLVARDLFDMQQPLVTDTYYFGRTQLVTDLFDRFRNGESSGLFGLRKTGKTSAVFKLRRLIESNQAGVSVYVDAQSPSVYALRWWELLGHLAAELSKCVSCSDVRDAGLPYDESNAGVRFQQTVEKVLRCLPVGQRRVLLIVDEIEHVVPELGPEQAKHWTSDFIPFWKTLRAVQTVNRGLAFLIVGVNAGAVERSSIERQDNPLFSLVGARYMPSFSGTEVSEMVRTLGRPMGLTFAEDAYTYLTHRYGGHPTLTRLACSWHHRRASELGSMRPVTLTATDLRASEDQCELELIPHVKHILEVLRQWYSLEYEMLQMLAQGDISDFQDFCAADPELKQHLDLYGLLRWEDGTPAMRIAVVAKFLKPSRRSHSPSSEEGTASDWLQMVTEISRLRNTLEPKLRRYIKRTLKTTLGPERWIDPVLAVVPADQRERLKGVDRDVILNDRLYLSNLIAVLESNWDKFKALEYSVQHRLEKGQVTLLLRYVNAHREDAHAKNVTHTEVTTLAMVCETLSAALDEQLDD